MQNLIKSIFRRSYCKIFNWISFFLFSLYVFIYAMPLILTPNSENNITVVSIFISFASPSLPLAVIIINYVLANVHEVTDWYTNLRSRYGIPENIAKSELKCLIFDLASFFILLSSQYMGLQWANTGDIRIVVLSVLVSYISFISVLLSISNPKK